MLGRFKPKLVRVEREPSLIGASEGLCGFDTIKVPVSLEFEKRLHPIEF